MARCRRTPIPAAGFFVRRGSCTSAPAYGQKKQREAFYFGTSFLLKEDDHDFVMSLEHRVTEESFSPAYCGPKQLCAVGTGGARGLALLFYPVGADSVPESPHPVRILPRQGAWHAGHGLWEDFLRENGYRIAVLSTQVDERAQFLYRRLGYVDCGGLVFHGTPYDQPTRALPAQGAVSPHAGQIAYKLIAAF